MGCSRIGFPIWTRCAAYSEALSNAAVATPMPWIPTPSRDSFMNVRICFQPSPGFPSGVARVPSNSSAQVGEARITNLCSARSTM